MKKHLILATALVVAGNVSAMSLTERMSNALGNVSGRASSAWTSARSGVSSRYNNLPAFATLNKAQQAGIIAVPVTIAVAAGVYVYNTYFATDATPEVTESAKSVEVTPVVEETEVVTEVVEAAPVKAAKAVRKPVAKRRVVRPAVRRGGCANGRCGRR